MRKLLSLYLFAAMTRVADAHTLTSDEGLPMQLVHQFLGGHHMPITALIVVAGIVLLRLHYKREKHNR